jgi:hypothetical protein
MVYFLWTYQVVRIPLLRSLNLQKKDQLSQLFNLQKGQLSHLRHWSISKQIIRTQLDKLSTEQVN